MRKGQTKTDKMDTEYLPSRTEFKLLEVLLDPASRLKTVTDICQAATISRETYYQLYKKPEFRALYKEEALGLIHRSLMQVVHSVVREAVRGSFQHALAILKMAGLYTEKMEVTTESYGDMIKRIREEKRLREELKNGRH